MPRSLRILLVEDEDPKRWHIERYLREIGSCVSMTVARSVNSALDALEREQPDVLLLDMSLPTFDVGERESGGRPQGFGGIEILRHMTLAEILCPTIVITGYEAFPGPLGRPVELSQLQDDLKREFPHLYRGALHYNSTYDEWKFLLDKALAELGIHRGTE